MRRIVYFFLFLSVGIGLGLYYGWRVSPVRFVQTSPAYLGEDYKSDTVLMVAEVFSVDHDVERAQERLGILGGISPVESVNRAILFSTELGYAASDVQLMTALADALVAANPTPVSGAE